MPKRSLTGSADEHVRGYPVTGEESRNANEAADNQRPFWNHFRHRARKHSADHKQSDHRCHEEQNHRMREDVVSEWASLSDQPEAETTKDHRAVPKDLRARHRLTLRRSGRHQACPAAVLPSAAWAAASRAMGTRNGEQDT